MDIAVTPFDPADEAAAARAYEILRQSIEHDAPDFPVYGSRQGYLLAVRHPVPGRRVERAFATVDGAPAGLVQLEFPERDNLGNVHLDLHVRPDRRRRGIGGVLHDHAVARARAAGRDRLISLTAADQGSATPTPGSAFAAATGATAALTDRRSRLDVRALDPARLAVLAAGCRDHSSGYRLVSWIGTPPDDLVDDVAELFGRLTSDAPTGDLAVEGERSDAAIIRGMEEHAVARGRVQCHAGAVHEESGRLVAWTTLVLQSGLPWHAWQSTTVVAPEHRGHRLGLAIKIHNLGYVRSNHPDLRAIDTYNAADNAPMIRINDALGFRPVDAWTSWQLTL